MLHFEGLVKGALPGSVIEAGGGCLRGWFNDYLYHETHSCLVPTDFPQVSDQMWREGAGVPLSSLSICMTSESPWQ